MSPVWSGHRPSGPAGPTERCLSSLPSSSPVIRQVSSPVGLQPPATTMGGRGQRGKRSNPSRTLPAAPLGGFWQLPPTNPTNPPALPVGAHPCPLALHTAVAKPARCSPNRAGQTWGPSLFTSTTPVCQLPTPSPFSPPPPTLLNHLPHHEGCSKFGSGVCP